MNEDLEFIDTLVKLKMKAMKQILECTEPKVKLKLIRELGQRLVQISREYKL